MKQFGDKVDVVKVDMQRIGMTEEDDKHRVRWRQIIGFDRLSHPSKESIKDEEGSQGDKWV